MNRILKVTLALILVAGSSACARASAGSAGTSAESGVDLTLFDAGLPAGAPAPAVVTTSGTPSTANSWDFYVTR